MMVRVEIRWEVAFCSEHFPKDLTYVIAQNDDKPRMVLEEKTRFRPISVEVAWDNNIRHELERIYQFHVRADQ